MQMSLLTSVDNEKFFKDVENSNEIILLQVQCAWTVEFLNLYESPFKQCILMEFIPGRNLLEELVVKKSLTIKQIRVYAAEMLACIFSVHRHGYIHSDIKLTNFMLDSYNHIKMCDFGLCVKFLLPHQCLEVTPSVAVAVTHSVAIIVRQRIWHSVSLLSYVYCIFYPSPFS